MAWRQLRGAVLGTAALTGIVSLVLLIDQFLARGIAGRLATACATNDTEMCSRLRFQFIDLFDVVARYLGYLPMTTVLVAAVWGAPMISREIESGTAALAWHQSVTRRRWLITRLAVSVASLTVLGLALGFSVTWWSSSFDALDRAGVRTVHGVLTTYGPLIPALWLAGLMVGVLVGSIIRRTLPAAAVTAVITFVGVIAFNILGGTTGGDRPDSLQVLAVQSEQALPVLAIAAAAAFAAFRRVPTLRI